MTSTARTPNTPETGSWWSGDFEGDYEAMNMVSKDGAPWDARVLELVVLRGIVRNARRSQPPAPAVDGTQQPIRQATLSPAWVELGDRDVQGNIVVHQTTLNDVWIVNWRAEPLVDEGARARGKLYGTLYARVAPRPRGCLPWWLGCLALLLLAMLLLMLLSLPMCAAAAAQMPAPVGPVVERARDRVVSTVDDVKARLDARNTRDANADLIGEMSRRAGAGSGNDDGTGGMGKRSGAGGGTGDGDGDGGMGKRSGAGSATDDDGGAGGMGKRSGKDGGTGEDDGAGGMGTRSGAGGSTGEDDGAGGMGKRSGKGGGTGEDDGAGGMGKGSGKGGGTGEDDGAGGMGKGNGKGGGTGDDDGAGGMGKGSGKGGGTGEDDGAGKATSTGGTGDGDDAPRAAGTDDRPKMSVDQALDEPERFFEKCGQSLVMSSDLLFDLDKDSLRPQSKPYLQKVARVLKKSKDPRLTIVVEGHADPRGSDAYNAELSERRARRIAAWLVENKAIDASRVAAKGFGERMPVVSAPPASDLQRFNRRVEITIACPPGGGP